MQISFSKVGEIDTITCENDQLRLVVIPSLGGKIASIYNKALDQEFMWTNDHLSMQSLPPGSEYDPNFFGGMDELIPNDIPETIDGIAYPDHGELWTTRLEFASTRDSLSVFGILPLSGLQYSKTIRLDAVHPCFIMDYEISNPASEERKFLWKLHPALRIEPGDELVTSATRARVVDPGYSRFTDLDEFTWPQIQGTDASRVPEKGNEVDFFFLWGAPNSEMSLVSHKKNARFTIQYDAKVFPFQWYFASYGGFLDHYTAVPEPCSAMPMSVPEAAALGQCTVLQSGQTLETTVRIYAGASLTQKP